jgi:hypothetical protein
VFVVASKTGVVDVVSSVPVAPLRVMVASARSTVAA